MLQASDAQYAPAGEGEGRTMSLHWARTHHTSITRGARRTPRTPVRPSTGPRKDRAPLFYQSPHMSHVQLRCNGNGPTPCELPPAPQTRRSPNARVVATRLRPCNPTCMQPAKLTVTATPRRRRLPPPPRTPPPPPPLPLLPLRTFSEQTRGLPERMARCHPRSPQR